MKVTRPILTRLQKIRDSLPSRLSRGMNGHHQLGRHFKSGGERLRSFRGYLHDFSHPKGKPWHTGPDHEEQLLACITAYTGITEDELEELIADVDSENGPENRATRAGEVLRFIFDAEKAHRRQDQQRKKGKSKKKARRRRG